MVTRPLKPVPSSPAISTPCSSAILRTSGLDFVRRSSSAVASAPLPLPLSLAALAGVVPDESLGSSAATSLADAVCFGAETVCLAGAGSTSAPVAADASALASGGATSAGFVTGCASGCGCPSVSSASDAAGAAAAGALAAAASAFAGGSAAPAAAPSSTATTVFISTVSPSLKRISVNVPAAGDGISASTLSVEISNSGSSRST